MSNIQIPANILSQEYEINKTLFDNQPVIVQRFLESQATAIAGGLISNRMPTRFVLPDRVVQYVKNLGQSVTITLPEALREQKISGLAGILSRRGIREALLSRLQELEQSSDQAVAASASLLRFATANYMISTMLPAGRSVTYRSNSDGDIPSIPVADEQPESAITQPGDAIVEQVESDSNRGELQTPFVPAARKFYLPQWVAFDGNGNMLAASEKEAEARVESMQKYVQILHRASSLAPYMVTSDEYQRKRYGMLGQLVNQGRALANFKNRAIIQQIKERVKKGTLNRGLSISMPYFDDQNLKMDEICFEVIPAGRIMFVPAFVARASIGEQGKVSQDTRLNSSTREHLLTELKALETAFQTFQN